MVIVLQGGTSRCGLYVRASRRGALLLAAALLVCSVASSVSAADDPLAEAFEDLTRGDDASETYALNALGVISTGSAEFAWRPVRGKYRRSISRDEFYRRTGRQDADAKEGSRETWHNVMYWGGWGMIASGMGFAYTSMSRESATMLWGGLGLLGTGLVIKSVSWTFVGPVIDKAEARAAADEHNKRLERHLRDLDEGPSIHVAFVPLLSTDSAGFALSAVF